MGQVWSDNRSADVVRYNTIRTTRLNLAERAGSRLN